VIVVLDTNVLLSALFTPGRCEVLLDQCIAANDVTIIGSEYILEEFVRHAVGKFRVPEDRVAAAARALRQHLEFVPPVDVPNDACPDPDDLPVLGTAVAGNANCLVTGDRQLLGIGSWRSIAIVSPRDFHERFLQNR